MDIYAENILDHFKNPRNYRRLENADLVVKESNPLCGDKIEIFLNVGKDGKILEASFEGEGCAISKAGSSMLIESIKGKSLEEISKLKKEDILDMLGIEISGARMKCATLALHALYKALSQYENNIRGK